MKILLISVGKPKSSEIVALAEEYARRIAHYAQFSRVCIREESRPDHAIYEGKKILEKIGELKDEPFVVVCDVAGKQMDSVGFAGLLRKRMFQLLVLVIGGSDGVSDAVRERAGELVSFSAMTFPHELFLVMAVEQVYRAFTIINNEKYHK